MDDVHSVRVQIDQDQPFVVDAVPANATAGDFLKALQGIDSVRNKKKDAAVKIGDRILKADELVDGDELEIVFRNDNVRLYWVSLLVVFLFIVAHSAPVLAWLARHDVWFCMTSYIISLAVFLFFFMLVRPPANVLENTQKINWKANVVIEIIWLFLQSCSPTFHLEDVLVANE